MADPYDFYADIASVTVAETGFTLLLLRSLPTPIVDKDGIVDPSAIFEGKTPVNAEIVARVRMSPVFAAQLRDLLNRVLDRQTQGNFSAASLVAVSGPTDEGGT